MMKYLLTGFICLMVIQVHSQRTVGTILLEDEATEGYTFFSPFSGTKAYIVDNCGRLINEWDRGTRPGLSAYFLDNGLMMRTYKPNPVGPFTSASNAGGLELVDWDNELVWKYELNTATELSHHDAVMMPNGNILMLTWELIYEDELIALGRDPNEIASEGFAWNERIIELEPIGSDQANIVWEWRIKDHYIQDIDPMRSNYGVVSEHPELFDINLPELDSPNSHSDLDYNHFNAIDYHEGFDQILISVRNSDEIWVIDHSTTTAEAAGHSGGRYDKGGDILYRWGNGSAYERAALSEEVLYGQHGCQWIDEGPHKDKIIIYNNGNGQPGQDFSTVLILAPDQEADGSYPVPDIEAYGPLSAEWMYGDGPGEQFYSPYLSNAQILPNGHTLINAGSPGDIFEINADKEMVWHYVIPLWGDYPATQGGNVNNNGNFRAYKYSPDYAGFDSIDIIAGDPIEIDPNPLDCDMTTSISDLDSSKPYLVRTGSSWQINNPNEWSYRYQLLDIQGRRCSEGILPASSSSFIPSLKNQNMYILHIRDDNGAQHLYKIVQMKN